MLTVPENILNDLEAQLTTRPKLLVLVIKDWLTYEQALKDFANTYMSISMKEDSPVPLTYKDVPVVMKTNEVKELIKELVSRNAPVPSVTPPTNSGPVKPMTKQERALEEPQAKRTGELIESLTDSPDWWNGDQVITEQPDAGQTQAS